MAKKIGKRQKREFDFRASVDQDYILGALVNEFVKWGHHALRFALSLDREYEDDDGGTGASWMDRLAADDTYDPMVLLELREMLDGEERMQAASYSQAAAYVIVFSQFDNDRQKICDWLVIADSTLTGRVRRALDTVRQQASLFDRVETIDETFMPQPGRQYLSKMAPTGMLPQSSAWAWF